MFRKKELKSVKKFVKEVCQRSLKGPPNLKEEMV